MKKFLFLILLFPLFVSAQFDLESNKERLNVVFLPEIENLVTNTSLSNIDFSIKKKAKLPSFRMNTQNYREPVNMTEAIANNQSYVKSDLQISLDPRELGIYGGSSSYQADGSTKVKNIAYKDAARGFFFAESCPPNGICPRCAPTRMGRSRSGFSYY